MCPDHEILSAYFDGEVLFPWNKHIEKHLASCARCREKIESFTALSATLAEDSDPDCSLTMDRVWNKIEERKQNLHYIRKPFWQKKVSLPIPLLAVAASLIFCIGFVIVFNTAIQDKSSVNIVTHKDDGSMTEVNITAKDAEEIEALLKALENNNQPNEVIIHLPEGSNEFHIGEPELIRAVEFKRKGNK